MPEHDAVGAKAHHLGGIHVFLLFLRQHGGTHGACNLRPFGNTDNEDQHVNGDLTKHQTAKTGLEDRTHDNGNHQGGERKLNVGDAYQDGIHPATQIARQQPEQNAKRRLQHHRAKTDQQGHAGAIKNGGEHIPALGVCTQRERRICPRHTHRRQLRVHDIDLRQIVRICRREQGRKNGCKHHQKQHDKAGNRYLVALEAIPEKGVAKAIPAGKRRCCHAFLPVSFTVGFTSP